MPSLFIFFKQKNFVERVGFTAAMLQIKSLVYDLMDDYQKVFIIGFSVGATVSWLCSEIKGVHGIVGYYGSRIRDFTEIMPKCPALLFFPENEKSFNVDTLISRLNKKNIELRKLNGEHGFGDPFSIKYDEILAHKALTRTVDFLFKHS